METRTFIGSNGYLQIRYPVYFYLGICDLFGDDGDGGRSVERFIINSLESVLQPLVWNI